MRYLLGGALLLFLVGGCSDRAQCAPRTLYLTLQFPSAQADGGDDGGDSMDGGAGGDPLAEVDKVRVTVTAKGQTGSDVVTRKAGRNTTVVKVTFTSYPEGEQAVVKTEAMRGDLRVYENPPTTVLLKAGCTAVPILMGINGCGAGTGFCDDTHCHDLQTESVNCGACGKQCPSGLICQSGRCECPAGLTSCDVNGTISCVDLTSDKTNCGECGNQCPSTSPSCNSGKCGCYPGNTACETGCTDITRDRNNCGSCGLRCTGTNSDCYNSQCVPPCSLSETRCSGSCVNLEHDSYNCGSCGNRCSDRGYACCKTYQCTDTCY